MRVNRSPWTDMLTIVGCLCAAFRTIPMGVNGRVPPQSVHGGDRRRLGMSSMDHHRHRHAHGRYLVLLNRSSDDDRSSHHHGGHLPLQKTGSPSIPPERGYGPHVPIGSDPFEHPALAIVFSVNRMAIAPYRHRSDETAATENVQQKPPDHNGCPSVEGSRGKRE